MTTLILVRHGQASFGSHDYDRLSEVGQRQSRVLGDFWNRLHHPVSAWYSGTLQRHRGTVDGIVEKLNGAAPAVDFDAAFNEYDHTALIRGYLPLLAAEDPQFRVEARKLFSNRKIFQAFFERVIAAWLAGRRAEGIEESWQDFCARVREGLARVTPRDADRVVVVTSGGVITVALMVALGLTDQQAFRANWRIYNASVHRFAVTRRGLSLTGFNGISHLELAGEPSLLTLR